MNLIDTVYTSESYHFRSENGSSPKRKRSYSNHPFSGAFAVSFREVNFGCFTKECQFFVYSFRRSCQILNKHGMKFLSRVPLNKLILACGRAQRPSRKRGLVCRNGTLFLWGKQWRFFFNSMQDLAIPCTNLEHTNFRFCYETTGVLTLMEHVGCIIFVP